MTTLSYKGYTITTGAIREEFTGIYRPLVKITWSESDGKCGMHSFTLPQQCFSEEEARLVAMHEAKTWADRWLRVGP